MTEPFTEVEPIDFEGIALETLDIVMDLLHIKGVVRRYKSKVETRPVSVEARGLARLEGKKGEYGTVRVTVTVPVHEDEAIIKVEWMMSQAGFWWTELVILRGAVTDLYAVPLGELVVLLDQVKRSAQGSISLKSMNLAFSKVRKNKTKDDEFERGLQVA